MPHWTVSRRGIEGPGAGGEYTYSTHAATEAEAIAKTAAKAARRHHRLNRGGTKLDPAPINVTRI